MVRIVYDRRVNLGFPGAQRFHPFDLRKFARAWQVLRKTLGPRLSALHAPIPQSADDESLRLAHAPQYLDSLRSSGVIAAAIEVPALRRAPWILLEQFVLRPMRWAAAGSIVAGRAALESGLAFNLGGGFHHAKPNSGEGFSIYNDIAVMIASLRREGRLTPEGRVAYIDLDAHLGNGVAWCFLEDSRIFHFDVHNSHIYPMNDTIARRRVDCPVELPFGCPGDEYLQRLREQLPGFLDSIHRSGSVELAIYNAGTDVLAEDQLGGLALSLEDVLVRDQFVLQALRQRQIPTVVLTSGGYSDLSYQAIARTILTTVSGPPPASDGNCNSAASPPPKDP